MEIIFGSKTPGPTTVLAKQIGFPANKLRDILYGPNNRSAHYKRIAIPKNSSTPANPKIRVLHAVSKDLKNLQRATYDYLAAIYSPTKYAKGFVIGESILTNAWPHRRQAVLLKFDIKDFFPSINFYRVRGMFMAWPFNFSPATATIYAQICCMDNGPIAQGAVTSPYISNMICRRLDKRLSQFAQKHHLVFTRYADDITLSSNSKHLAIKKVQQEVVEMIESEKFIVNKEKSKVLFPSQRQMVTGIVVNDGVNVPRKYIKQVRAILYKCETLGVARVVSEHLTHVKPGQPCAPIHRELKPTGEYLDVDVPINRDVYMRNGTDKEISFYQVTLIFLSHLRGRILYIGQVAKANHESIWEVSYASANSPRGYPERTVYLKRYKIYRELLDRYNSIVNFEDYGKELSIKVKSLESRYMEEEEIDFFMARDIEQIKSDMSERAETEARFFYSISPAMLENDIKDKLLIMLNRFPPDIITTRAVLQSAQDTGSMIMRLLHNEVIQREEFDDYFNEYLTVKEKLPYRLEKEITAFLKEASYLFRRENIDEYNFYLDEQFNRDRVIPFKNNSRFVLNPRKTSGGTDAYEMIKGIVHSRAVRDTMNENSVRIMIPEDQNEWRIDLYTHVSSVKWSLHRIIESMVVNSQDTIIHITFEVQREGFSTLRVYNDDVTEIANDPSRAHAHGKH